MTAYLAQMTDPDQTSLRGTAMTQATGQAVQAAQEFL